MLSRGHTVFSFTGCSVSAKWTKYSSRWLCTNRECLVPAPSWSLKDLNLSTTKTTSIVSETDVQALCKLSCIDLQFSQTSVQSVVDDINVILRCADSIKGNENEAMTGGCEERLFTDNTLNMSTLRDDVADLVSHKDSLLSHAVERTGDYFTVPNVNAKRHGQKEENT